jgi:hypothetical protein
MSTKSRARDHAKQAWKGILSVSVFVFFCGFTEPPAAPGPVYPRTQYKPADIAAAKQNIARYLWAKDILLDLKKSSESYLSMDRDKIRSFIPDKTPLAAIKCPVCSKAPWSWYNLLEDGEILECVDCKTRWRWDPADTSETWNIPAVHRYYRLDFILKGVIAAGLLDQVEGDRRLAEKAAVIIERFAEVFKGYRINMIHRNQWLDRPDPYYAKIAGWKHREMGMIHSVLLAYDLIHDSGALTPTQIEKIDRDLVAYTRDYLLEGYGPGGPASPPSIQDQGYSWWSLAACGALLGDQKTLAVIVDAFEKALDPTNSIFYEDGSFFEGSPSYQEMFMGPISSIPDVIAGNTERGVYSNPRCSLLEKLYTWTLDFVFPSDAVPAINDAHVGALPGKRFAEIARKRYGNKKAARYLFNQKDPGEEVGIQRLFEPGEPPADNGEPYGDESVHLKGAGLMVLRQGSDRATQTMAFLDYGAFEPPNRPPYHKHRDYLNIGLWACGREMISEMGYAMTPPWVQRWQVSPIAHNTVIQAGEQKEGGRPLIWHITPGPKMAEAGLPPANSRFIALLPRAVGEPVIVDIFRISGDASEFTWAMHARSNDLKIGSEVNFAEAVVEEPLRNGKKAEIKEGPAEALWRFPGDHKSGLKVLFPAVQPFSLIASECPAEEDEIKNAFLSGGNPKPGVPVPYRGHIQIKKTGPEAVFIVIYVPFSGEAEPSVKVAFEAFAGAGVGLKIDIADEGFIIIHNPIITKREFSGLNLDGRAGIASFREGKLVELALSDGRALTHGSTGIFRNTIGNAHRALGSPGLKAD